MEYLAEDIFQKERKNRTHHIHIFQVGNKHIKAHLEFKDYLIQHPIEAKSYGDLKVQLAKQFSDNTKDYQFGKESFVNELMRRAKKWSVK